MTALAVIVGIGAAAVTGTALLVRWSRRKIARLTAPPETADAKIARWNREAAAEREGVSGDSIARLKRWQADLDAQVDQWKTEWDRQEGGRG